MVQHSQLNEGKGVAQLPCSSLYYLCPANALKQLRGLYIQLCPIPTLYCTLPASASCSSALDLKDASFCVPLGPETQNLFDLKNPLMGAGQLTWTVLCRGFQDSSHLFGRALAQDLLEQKKKTSPSHIMEIQVREGTQPLLNFLAS